MFGESVPGEQRRGKAWTTEMIRVRRVGSSAIHGTTIAAPSEPSEGYGRAERVLKASKVVTACGAVLAPTEKRPVLVMRSDVEVSCRACRLVMG